MAPLGVVARMTCWRMLELVMAKCCLRMELRSISQHGVQRVMAVGDVGRGASEASD